MGRLVSFSEASDNDVFPQSPRGVAQEQKACSLFHLLKLLLPAGKEFAELVYSYPCYADAVAAVRMLVPLAVPQPKLFAQVHHQTQQKQAVRSPQQACKLLYRARFLDLHL